MGGLGAQKVRYFARSQNRRFSLVNGEDGKETESGWRCSEVKSQYKAFPSSKMHTMHTLSLYSFFAVFYERVYRYR
jgi:hypothetical protein